MNSAARWSGALRRAARSAIAGLAKREIDRPSIVGIDQVEVPQLAALIDVGHAGRREFADGLNEAVLDSKPRHPPHEGQEIGKERVGPQRFLCERLRRLLVVGVGRGPARAAFRLAQRLLDSRVDADAIGFPLLVARGVEHVDRPGAHEHLVEHVFVVAVGRGRALDVAASRSQDAGPGLDLPAPFLRHFGENGEPRPIVFAALGVVRRGRQHGVRPVLGARGVRLVKEGRGEAKPLRRAADFVERDEPIVAIESGVLDPFGHHRA